MKLYFDYLSKLNENKEPTNKQIVESAKSDGVKFLKDKMLEFVDINGYYTLYDSGTISSTLRAFGPFPTFEEAKENTKAYKGSRNSYYSESAKTVSGKQLLSKCTTKIRFDNDKVFDPLKYINNKDQLDALVFFGYSSGAKEDKAKELESKSNMTESKKRMNESEKIHQFSHKVFRTLDQKRKVIFKVIDHPGWEAEWVEHWCEELQPDAETWDDVTDDTILVLFDRLQDKIFTEIKYYGDDAEFSSYIYGLFGIKVYD